MGANLRHKVTGSTGSGRWRAWLVVVALVSLGALIHACTNQSDTKGPTFPASQTGDNPTAATVLLFDSPGPGGDQVTLTLVVRSPGGQPVVGRPVFMSTTAGQLSRTSGVTDDNGQFTSVLNCDGTNVSTVSALVENVLKTKSVCSAAAGATGATGSTGP